MWSFTSVFRQIVTIKFIVLNFFLRSLVNENAFYGVSKKVKLRITQTIKLSIYLIQGQIKVCGGLWEKYC